MGLILMKKELKALWILHHIQMYGFEEFPVVKKSETLNTGMVQPGYASPGFAGFMMAE
jgi:hypothetical protein